MINAMRRFNDAIRGYNHITGEGANDLLLALLEYQKKLREVDEALAKVDKILGGNK